MASDHPFQLLFETLGRLPTAHAESVNRQAHEVLADLLTVPVERRGRCIMLRAPRAGHGKTHLLSRIQHELGASCEFIPLHAPFGCKIDADSVTVDTLRRLVRQLPAAGGLTVLDLVTRRLFASALQPLVGSGEVPCQDREGALTALRARPIETFDFHHPNAVTAHWARENFEVLGQRLSQELAQRADLPVGDVAFWVDALFRFASAPLENTSRVRTLVEVFHADTGLEMERLVALLGLLTLLMRVVLVADDLEGFSADETAALRLAAFLGSLRQSVERLDVILSLNQDIWQSAFLPRLSGGLADRLSEVVVELEPLKESEMADLLDSRVPGLGSRVLERIDIPVAGTHARGLIRAAGLAWLKATAVESPPPQPTSPVIAAGPVMEAAPAPYAAPPAAAIEDFAPVPEAVPVAEVPVIEPERLMESARVHEPTEAFAAPFAPEIDPGEVESPAFTFSPEPVMSPVEESFAWPVPEFTPAAVVDVEGEADNDGPAEDPFFQFPEPAAAFSPQTWPETPQSLGMETAAESEVLSPPLDSPFQVAAPQSEGSGGWQDPTQSAMPQEPGPSAAPPFWIDSPFQVASEPWDLASPVEQAPSEPEPALIPPSPPVETAPPPSASDTDRVDDLLRQFRERYGRGSL